MPGRLAFVLCLLAALQSCSSNDSSGGGPACESDADCKGDRVCEDGACVSPGAGSESTSTSGSDVNPFSEKCAVACAFGDCMNQDGAAKCASDCVVVTGGLESTCAQCVVDNTAVHGNASAPDICYYEVAKPTSECASSCVGDFSSETQFADKCAVVCAFDGCSNQADATVCVSECQTVTQGLTSECAQCVVDSTAVHGNGGGGCNYEVGKPSSSECANYCGG
jgi:hypothetical protein